MTDQPGDGGVTDPKWAPRQYAWMLAVIYQTPTGAAQATAEGSVEVRPGEEYRAVLDRCRQWLRDASDIPLVKTAPLLVTFFTLQPAVIAPDGWS